MHKYRRFLQYARPHWHSFALIFIATLAASALAALQPWPMKLLVDHILGHDPLPHWFQTLLATLSLEPTPSRLLLLIVAAGLALFALNGALEVTLTWAWTLSGRRMVYDLAEELYARLQRRSLLYHTRHAVGDTMGRVVTDSWCVYQVFDACLFAPAHALLTMLVMIVLMAQSDVALTLLALATAPFMLGASFLVGRPLRAAAKLKRDIETRIQSHLQQTLTGIPVVQAFAQEAREEERFHQFADAAIAAQQRSTLIGSVNSLASGLVTTLGIGVILWVGARHVMSGGLSIGSLLVFLVYLTLLQNQMKVLTEVNTKLQGFSASVDRVFGVIDSEPDLKEMPGAIQLVSARGHVRLENVLFGYEPDQAVLRGVSLEALPGQIVAIVGATGAGKTTLVNLLPRFFDPWQGRVLMDGCDLRDLGLRSLRAQIAFVLQEPFLFPVSVAGNIAFGRPESARGEIEAAARAANAHEFIRRLPQGYDTVIGERGATLSGGERQRLSIARALLRNAPILILDEPTSALDAETERLIFEALERLMRGRTTFLIAHRLSTVRRADRIVVLKNGLVAESGTHDELLDRGELYAHLDNIAFEPRKKAASAAN